jgi:hypothetical protein
MIPGTELDVGYDTKNKCFWVNNGKKWLKTPSYIKSFVQALGWYTYKKNKKVLDKYDNVYIL